VTVEASSAGDAPVGEVIATAGDDLADAARRTAELAFTLRDALDAGRRRLTAIEEAAARREDELRADLARAEEAVSSVRVLVEHEHRELELVRSARGELEADLERLIAVRDAATSQLEELERRLEMLQSVLDELNGARHAVLAALRPAHRDADHVDDSDPAEEGTRRSRPLGRIIDADEG